MCVYVGLIIRYCLLIVEGWEFPHSAVGKLETQRVSGIVRRLQTHGVESSLNLKVWKLGALRAGEDGYPAQQVRQRVNSTIFHFFVLFRP